MKKLFVLLSFITVASIGSYSQDIEDAKTDSIVFEKLVHDYGTIAQGANGNCEFKFTNKGEKPLVLSNVRASCGCTVPTWPKNPIEPGKSGVIEVSYNTDRVGNFSKTVTVNSNAANSKVILRIKGKVTTDQ